MSGFLCLLLLSQHHSPVTPVTTLCAEAREAAQKLLNHYVKVSCASRCFFTLHTLLNILEKYGMFFLINRQVLPQSALHWPFIHPFTLAFIHQ